LLTKLQSRFIKSLSPLTSSTMTEIARIYFPRITVLRDPDVNSLTSRRTVASELASTLLEGGNEFGDWDEFALLKDPTGTHCILIKSPFRGSSRAHKAGGYDHYDPVLRVPVDEDVLYDFREFDIGEEEEYPYNRIDYQSNGRDFALVSEVLWTFDRLEIACIFGANLGDILEVNDDILANKKRLGMLIQRARTHCVHCDYDISDKPVPDSYWTKVGRVWHGKELFDSVSWNWSPAPLPPDIVYDELGNPREVLRRPPVYMTSKFDDQCLKSGHLCPWCQVNLSWDFPIFKREQPMNVEVEADEEEEAVEEEEEAVQEEEQAAEEVEIDHDESFNVPEEDQEIREINAD
jgi:hypothetical protein